MNLLAISTVAVGIIGGVHVLLQGIEAKSTHSRRQLYPLRKAYTVGPVSIKRGHYFHLPLENAAFLAPIMFSRKLPYISIKHDDFDKIDAALYPINQCQEWD